MTKSIALSDMQNGTNTPWAASGSTTSITYTFISSANAGYYSDLQKLRRIFQKDPGTGLATADNIQHISAADGGMETAFKTAAQAWMNVANITLDETGSADPIGNIAVGAMDFNKFYRPKVDGTDVSKIGGATQATSTAAPNYDPQLRGDIWYNANYQYYTSNGLKEGGLGFYSVLHELGHALGLKGDNPFPNGTYDSTRYSVMSYNDSFILKNGQPINAGPDGYQAAPNAPMLFDIARIQYLYGANANTATGDDTYKFKLTNGWPIQAIWDAGGNDTIDGSNQSARLNINLNAGGESYVMDSKGSRINGRPEIHIAFQPLLSDGTPDPRFDNNFIDNALGGSGDDHIAGNKSSNILHGNGGNDLIFGDAGNDVLNGGKDSGTLAKHDNLYGGEGNDTYVYVKGDGWDEIIDDSGTSTLVINNISVTGSGMKKDTNKHPPKDLQLGESWKGTLNGEEIWCAFKDGDLNNGGTLVIYGAALGGSSDRITLDGFENGKFGITLDPANSVASLTGSNNMVEDGGDIVTATLAGIARQGEQLVISCNPSVASRLQVCTGAETLSFNADGTLTLDLSAGDTQAIFSLLSTGNIDSDTSITLTATVKDASGQTVGAASSLSIALDATDSVSSTNADEHYWYSEVAVQETESTSTWAYSVVGSGPLGILASSRLETYNFTTKASDRQLTDPAAYFSEYVDRSTINPTIPHPTVFIPTSDYVGTVAGLGDSYIDGSAYRDVMTDGANSNFHYTTSFYDGTSWQTGTAQGYLYGNDNDVLIGGLGNDLLFTHGGNDRSEGGEGDDVIIDRPVADQRSYSYSSHTWFDTAGNVNNDRLVGGAGNDLIVAGGGNALLEGGDGADELYAGMDDDTLLGGDGDDVLWGDGQQAHMNVWTGIDYVDAWTNYNGWLGEWVQPVLADANVNAYDWTVTVNWADAAAETYHFNGIVEATTYTGKDFLDGGNGNDELRGGGNSDVLYGGAGNDTLLGDAVGGDAIAGDDYLNGEDGNDRLTGMAGADTLIGGIGEDVLVGDGDEVGAEYQGNDYLDGGDGIDYLWGNGGSDTLLGGDGNDYLQGDSTSTPESVQGNDYLDGGAGNDTLIGDGGNDTLLGGAGNDQLDGGKGDDYLSGGMGTDNLWGGEGNDILETGPTGNLLASGDVLQGQAGDDTYILNEGMGSVRIEDTEGANSLVFAGASSADVGVQMVDGLIVLTLGNGDSVVMSAATANTMDNGLYSSKLVQNADGSTDATITTYGGDGSSIGHLFSTSSTGALTKTTLYYDSSSSLTHSLTLQPNGSTSNATYAYADDGSKTVTTLTTAANGTDVTTTVDEFDTKGHLVHRTATNPDGSTSDRTYVNRSDGSKTVTTVSTAANGTDVTTTVDEINPDGQVSHRALTKGGSTWDYTYIYNSDGVYSHVYLLNPDGTTSHKIYAYQPDGSKTITEATALAGGTPSTTTVFYYDAAGDVYRKIEVNPDGSTVDKTILNSSDGTRYMTVVSTLNGSTVVSTVQLVHDSAGRLLDLIKTKADGTVVDFDYSTGSSYYVSHVRTTKADGSITDKTYTYGSGGHSEEIAVTRTGHGTVVTTNQYDSYGDLKIKKVSESNGSTVTDYYDQQRLVEEDTHTVNADGTQTNVKSTYGEDGTLSAIASSQLDQNGGFLQRIDQSYNSNGTLKSRSIVNTDGSNSFYTYSAGHLIELHQRQVDGSDRNATYVYDASGSSTETVVTKASDSSVTSTLTTNYNAAGTRLSSRMIGADGTITVTKYNANNSIASTDTQNPDYSYALTVYTYNADGSKLVTVTTIPALGGAGKQVATLYNASGVKVGTVQTNETKTKTIDADGKTTTHYFDSTGFETHSTWTKVGGITGDNHYAKDGSSSGSQHNADGTFSTYSKDGKGNVLNQDFNASGVKVSDTWQHSDGSHGTDTFIADGTSEGVAYYADGSMSQTYDDDMGYHRTDFFDLHGVLNRSVGVNTDGDQLDWFFAADGSVLTSAWRDHDGAGNVSLQSNGHFLEISVDSQGNSHRVEYDTNNYDDVNDSTIINGRIEYFYGGVEDFAKLSDGSYVKTYSQLDGAFGFEVYNGITGELRTLDYQSPHNWWASDTIDIQYVDNAGNARTETICSVALSAWDGEVRYYDNTQPLWIRRVNDGYLYESQNVATRIDTDTDFGLDPLRGLTLTPVDNGDGVEMKIRASTDALKVFSSDMATSYVNAHADPLASVHDLIALYHDHYPDPDSPPYYDPSYYDASTNSAEVLEVVYNSQHPLLSGYLTYQSTANHYHHTDRRYAGVNGTFADWSGDLNHPAYTSGGSSGGGSLSPNLGSHAGGSFAGGFGTTTVQSAHGQLTYGNGLSIGSGQYLENSSAYIQTTFTGTSPL